jgi:2-iminobutanoate/2-iminopropanoate deaminase
MAKTPQVIKVQDAPPQNDTYSQAVRLGDVIYISGQLGVRPDGMLPDSFQAQVRQALENVRTVLRAAGSDLSLVAKVNIYVTDFSKLREMNEVYPEYFPHRPAKTTVEISRLDKGAQIEVEVIAAAGA